MAVDSTEETLEKISFEREVEKLVERDSRYDTNAYLFLRDALQFTISRARRKQESEERHASVKELLGGVRDHALEQFGPMVPTVFEDWGIKDCEDIGEMVFNLIESNLLQKTESDKREEFSGQFDFHEAFVKPFLPDRDLTFPLGQ